MTHPFFKRLQILLVSILLGHSTLYCCSSGYEYTSNFDKALLFGNAEYAESYSLWFYKLSDYTQTPDYNLLHNQTILLNVQDWADFFEGKYTPDSLISVIYRSQGFESNHKELTNLRNKRSTDLKLIAKEESFIEYLKLALEVEAISGNQTSAWRYDSHWDDNSKYQRADVQEDAAEKVKRLVQQGEELINGCQFSFIQERTAYQLVKLYRYNGQFHLVEEVFNQYFTGSTSFISYWAMEHLAGALFHLERKDEANYLFSKVYMNAPSRQLSAYNSLHIVSQYDFDAAKRLCISDEEKSGLHFIRGMMKSNLAYDDMNFIAKMVGNHGFVRILMCKEIAKIESKIIDFNQNNSSYSSETIGQYSHRYALRDYDNQYQNQMGAFAYLDDLIKMSNKMMSNDSEDSFWRLSTAYLYYLKGDFSSSQECLGTPPTDQGMLKMYEAIRAFNVIEENELLSLEHENEVGEILFFLNDSFGTLNTVRDIQAKANIPTNRGTDINRYIFNLLYGKYLNQGNFYKSIIFNCNHSSNQLLSDILDRSTVDSFYKNLQSIQNLLDTQAVSPKSALTKFGEEVYFAPAIRNLTQRISHHQLSNDSLIRIYLHKMKGKFLLSDINNIADAIKHFEKLPEESLDTMANNPFAFKFKPYGSDSIMQTLETPWDTWTTLDLSRCLDSLRNESKQEDQGKNLINFSVAYLTQYSDEKLLKEFLNEGIQSEYLTREEKAQALFIMSRCDRTLYSNTTQYGLYPRAISLYGYSIPDLPNYKFSYNSNLWGVSKWLIDRQIWKKQNEEMWRENKVFWSEFDEAYSESFKVLKEEYADTEFYQLAVKECAVFELYVGM